MINLVFLLLDIIGIQALFGGFLAGLVIPHDNGFAIAVVEKFEDLVSILFLPLVISSHLL
jgi:Kef-type K+ transport system membrane component KefB